ncbi:MAG: type II toxin-antitoxin system Phd/YefM family antitoxin [Lentisphaeria bacterium]|nr:type II toxin-antitoxin system Phd/YefM family antitoxin [Lentisphaeria bacterium]
MLTIHPNILKKNGKKEFAVLPYDEFERITEELADYEDLKDLRSAKSVEGDVPGKALSEVRATLGI